VHVRPHHEPFRAPSHPLAPPVCFYYVASGWWNPGLEGVDLWPILAPICWIFLSGECAHVTNRWVSSHQLFCNDVCLLQEHQNISKHVIWCSGWSGVDIWLWKVGFTPRKIKHGPRDRQFGSSSAVESLQAGLPSNTRFETCPSRGPYPEIMRKPYPPWASGNLPWQLLHSFDKKYCGPQVVLTACVSCDQDGQQFNLWALNSQGTPSLGGCPVNQAH